ncbi:hypothetical protein MXD63_15120 [Frankia sp. Cpl3]|nr:hypothetical protein [Frankia sp. Cpl3]
MAAAPGGHDEIGQLIDRDEAYDEDPCGDPPLLVARYRASLRAVLAARPAQPDTQARAWTGQEHEAYLAGGRATLRTVVGAVAAALTEHPPGPARVGRPTQPAARE